MRLDERLNHVPCLKPSPTPITLDSYHTMPNPMCDKIHHLWITSNDHFIKHIHLFSNQNLFGCYTSMIIYIQNHVSFVGSEFPRSHRWLHKPSYTFTGFHCWTLCIIKNNEAFTRGGIYPYLLLPDTYFHFHVYNRATLLNVVPSYRAHPIKHQMQC